ncbi:bifunctional metallophosphatase/5'-nucleotidase [Paraglaciecola aquimarina]|uniref:Bifunctional metallophosphatase/5'-nucleotidase n=1 Tax=Paraglaciecola algarum TaxID=3050085 RepID=A0ABS9D9Q2_9ALTE|nr:5'-nucleotidase C-terminal domain-containing protein [Paraglaciecola sp. G1-23]MCF2948743.1 bifunctional metallophosphatase/5'-nucleotidase [Paraglaciecola sp. G1-23]
MPKLSTLLFLMGTFLAATNCLADDQQVQIIFAANMQNIANSDQGNYSRLSSLLNQQRQIQENNSIFVFGGGSLGPSPMAGFDRGSHIVDILNSLEPDLMTVRKREFSYYEDELSLRSDEAAFPLVASNIIDPLTSGNIEGLYNNVIINKNGHKVGFLSILEEELVQEYLLNRVKVFESQTIVEGQAKKLRRQGADFVVMVFSKKHAFYKELLDSGLINIAIRARSDRDNANLNTLTHPNIFSITDDDRALLLNITWSASKPDDPTVTSQEVLLNEYPEDPLVSMQINEYNHRLDRLLNQTIGQLNVPIDTSRELVRTQENAFANFVTDTLREYYQADVAFINGGSIRGNKKYIANTILTRRDIATELPYRNRVTRASATGEQIRQALEHGVSEVELIRGRFLHVSGLSYSFSSTQPSGNRVTNIKINGMPIDLNKRYLVATDDYLANGGDGFDSLSNKLDSTSSNTALPLISDIVILNIQKLGKIAPLIESRVVRLD